MNMKSMKNGWILGALAGVFFMGCGESTGSGETALDVSSTGDAEVAGDVLAGDGPVDTQAPQDVSTGNPRENDSSEMADDAVEPEPDVPSEDGSDGEGEITEVLPLEVYEYTRLVLKQPARIWSIRAMVEVGSESPVEVPLFIWDDFGGNYMSFDYWNPMAVATAELSAADSGTWVTFELETPLDVDPGRLIYVGAIVDPGEIPEPVGPFASEESEKGETEWLKVHDGTSAGFNTYAQLWDIPASMTRLHVDEASTSYEGDTPPPSLVYSPNDPLDELGFPPISASYDFMIELEVEWTQTVDAHDFVPVTEEESGLPNFSRGAMEDVDGDGAVDVLLGGQGLFINQGEGVFLNDTASWFGEVVPGNGMFGDYDNDGDADFFENGLEDRLFRNDGGVFVNVTEESGISDQMDFLCDGVGGIQSLPTEAVSWIDANGDGWLDLYQGNFICWGDGLGAQDILWINQGDGTFVDGTEAAGMREPQQKDPNNAKYYYLASRGMAPSDYDSDGDMDLFVGNYRLHRNLMWDQGDTGSFTNTGEANLLEGYGVKQGFQTWYGHTIGAVWGDVDQDGDLDTFHANLAHPRFFDFSDLASLYVNDGEETPGFTDMGKEIGIRYQETPSNPNFLDYDGDGDLDLFYTCIYEGRPSQFYRNDGHPAWKEVSYQTGVAVMNGWGSITGDLDMDGDVDLLASTGHYRNENLSGNGSIWVRPKGSGAGATNTSGFGARVRATINGVLIMRELAGSHGTSVQSSPFLQIGLGAEESADLEVVFPLTDTIVQVPDVAAGSRLVVHEDGTIESY